MNLINWIHIVPAFHNFSCGINALELDHARVGEKERRGSHGHEARGGHDRMAVPGEVVEEAFSYVRGGHMLFRIFILIRPYRGLSLRAKRSNLVFLAHFEIAASLPLLAMTKKLFALYLSLHSQGLHDGRG